MVGRQQGGSKEFQDMDPGEIPELTDRHHTRWINRRRFDGHECLQTRARWWWRGHRSNGARKHTDSRQALWGVSVRLHRVRPPLLPSATVNLRCIFCLWPAETERPIPRVPPSQFTPFEDKMEKRFMVTHFHFMKRKPSFDTGNKFISCVCECLHLET